jgi:acetolactate synthase-1/2/3 large subunit
MESSRANEGRQATVPAPLGRFGGAWRRAMQQQAGRALGRRKTDQSHESAAEFGSDVVVEMLQALGVRYIALNPGASYRGLHDSLVNFGITPGPQIVLCCHEAIAVAVAGGYARVTGQPIAVGLHNVVGLQNAAMAIYSAYCDRSPMLLLGGTGPMDSTKRRPHIDWVHTALVQGNQVRDYVKWDDQPGSVAAVPESVLRAHRISMTEPHGPVYLCFDLELQEQPIDERPQIPDVGRFAPPIVPAGDTAALRETARLLVASQFPLLVPDTMGRNRNAVASLEELAEVLGCGAVDQSGYFNFPSTSPLDLTMVSRAAIGDADLVLGLDVIDLYGALSGGIGPRQSATFLGDAATVVHITLGDFLQSKWAGDNERLFPVDLPIAANTAEAVPALVDLCREALAADPSSAARVADRRERVRQMHDDALSQARSRLQNDWDLRPISSYRLYKELWDLIEGSPWSLVGSAGRAPLRAIWEFTEPDHKSGVGRGAGIGYSAAAALGAALAYKDSGRLPICVVGDGSFLMLPQLLWTAANSELPILYVIFNNRSYFNDEEHQEFVARVRGRSIENKGIGLRLDEPQTNFAGLARDFGVAGFGPILDPDDLRPALAEAIRTVREERRAALVDVIVQPR